MGVLPILFEAAICLTPGGVVAPSLPGVTRLRRRHCGETKPVTEPGPLALLPVARSPSRPGYPEPLVGSYPTLSPLTRTC